MKNLIVFLLSVLLLTGCSPKTTGNLNNENNSSSAESSVITEEHDTALKTAKMYSDTFKYSKEQIYNLLISDPDKSFPEDIAQYAVDNVDADWKQNALTKAKTYSLNPISKAVVYNQLVSEDGDQFTEEQAQYAVDNVQTDWKENALDKAEMYKRTTELTNENIQKRLVEEDLFTQEEAEYAIKNLK